MLYFNSTNGLKIVRAKLKISQQLKIIPTFYGIGFGIIGNIA